ncbi:MBL fold metallo-hydrolase [Corynebacterium mycetoides]|uniref:MBL fold metallo-hydrolase n=1 Tax=Corynebacterium mycetoides TaxID=38302 RepID=UPI000B86DB52|nr:MBL fold metallo-hydrolase [Corynebacterium mycetoides]
MITSTFYGTSSVHVTDGDTNIFVDAFLTRPSLARLVFRRLEPDEAIIDAALARGGVDKLDALFVAHSHHDHLLDAPRVADKLGATLYGSRSTLNYGRREGLREDRLAEIAGGSRVTVGDFTVTVVEAPHSPGNVAPGVIRGALASPCHVLEFKDGGCFVFHLHHPGGEILVLPSANYRPGFVDGLRADVVYLGIGALGRQPRQFQEAYWANTAGALQPATVIPIHWDNFGRPLSKPFTPLPFPADNVRASRRFLEDKAARAGCDLRFPEPFSVHTL